jgi:hypothetical protein
MGSVTIRIHAPSLALFFFAAMVEASFDDLDRTQMTSHRNFARSRAQAPGAIARVLRIPGTLAFLGLAR